MTDNSDDFLYELNDLPIENLFQEDIDWPINHSLDVYTGSVQNTATSIEVLPVTDYVPNYADNLPNVSSINNTPENKDVQNISYNLVDKPVTNYDYNAASESSMPLVQSDPTRTQNLDQPGPSSSKPTSSKACKRQGSFKHVEETQKKIKLYEIEEPFEDQKRERDRLNAIKSYKNRQEQKKYISQLNSEIENLKVSLENMKASYETLEASNETLKASNEDLKASIEELADYIRDIDISVLSAGEKLELIRKIDDKKKEKGVKKS